MAERVKQQNKAKLPGQEDVIDLLELFWAVIKYWWLMLLVGTILGGLAFMQTRMTVSPSYDSSFTAYINNSDIRDSYMRSNSDIYASRELATTYAEIITSEPVVEAAIKEIGMEDISYEMAKASLSVGVVNETEVIRVSVTSNDPAFCYKFARAMENTAPVHMADIVRGSSMKILSHAKFPANAYLPSYTRRALLGFIFGAGLVGGIICLLEIMNNCVKSREALEDKYEIPVLGSIHDLVKSRKSSGMYYYKEAPKAKKKKSRKTKNPNLILDDTASFLMREDYNMVQTNLDFSFPDDNPKVIAFTSTTRGEGKSTNAINLAIACAEMGKKVLLIDCDLRLPSIKRKLGAENMKESMEGLSHFLAAKKGGSRIIVPYDKCKIDVVFSGAVPPNPTRLLQSERMGVFLKEAKKRYDYIILDCPPVNVVVDAVLLSPYVDGYIMIVKHRSTLYKDINAMLQQMEKASAKILGFLYVNVPVTESQYYRKSKKYYR